ncbi:hypothetical protein O7627_36850 [Solwaraspora sp. WMMD1047]|uniref:hypothetical protein n=1 Tax=Solwaraspora sp. WMMD1047 TaxID=3016102 RepID=UPI002416B3CC|nr:hypothetical protein [Solwaraspora sp. WMMD1047]MDG4834840.1 hypothetical protein [Solwaraspora sp. WMMD1047]
MIERDMACAVCGYALNAIDHDGRVTFEHPVTPRKDGHDPQPIPAYQHDDLYRRCHMCSTDEPLWVYRTPEIDAVSVGGTFPVTQTYSTRWNACARCAQLIEQDDDVTLTRRSSAAMGWRPTDLEAQILAGIHRTIVRTREPGRVLLTVGEWEPANLKAATLPKVRDRLAGLFRGPVELPTPLDNRETRGLLAGGLDQARLYWIDAEFTSLVAEVLADLPNTAVTDRIVPAGSGLLTWSNPIDRRHRIAAVSWAPQPTGWHVVCYRSLGLDLPSTAMETVRREVGWLVPVHATHLSREAVVNGDDPLAGLIATWLTIAQQLTQGEATRVDSSIRKAYARAHRELPEVRLVGIKPASSPPRRTGPATTHTPGGRAKPDHRYWVGAHTRNQAYGPGRSLRKEIAIDPFLKGPQDAPIKASTTVRILGTTRAQRSEDESPPADK